MVEVTSADWLSSGGAYYILGTVWVVTAIFFYFLADRTGKITGSENDGCLLGICNVLVTFFGGGVGLLLLPFPGFILTSIFGAVLFPTLVTLIILRRLQKGR